MRPPSAAALALCLAACASAPNERPTRDIFEQIVTARTYAFSCVGDAPPRLVERLEALLPWLDTAIGTGEAAAIAGMHRAELATTDFVRCPTAADRARAERRIRSLFSELERRAGSR